MDPARRADVVAAAADDTAWRIVEQLIENDQREAPTDADRIRAWRALELERLSATAITKRTGAKQDRIKTSLAVAACGVVSHRRVLVRPSGWLAY